jgi:dihydroorotase
LGTLKVGAVADLTVIDPVARWTVDVDHQLSKSKNTPFKGRELTGRAVLTLVRGEVVFSRLG